MGLNIIRWHSIFGKFQVTIASVGHLVGERFNLVHHATNKHKWSRSSVHVFIYSGCFEPIVILVIASTGTSYHRIICKRLHTYVSRQMSSIKNVISFAWTVILFQLDPDITNDNLQHLAGNYNINQQSEH